MTYIVVFEVASEANKTALINKLKTYGSFCPVTEHCWAIMTDDNSVAVREKLTPTLASGDRLFVFRSGTEAAWRNSFGEKHSAWLKENL
jgi:hypothetical protein